MKKSIVRIAALLLVLLMISYLAGCGRDQSTSPENSISESVQPGQTKRSQDRDSDAGEAGGKRYTIGQQFTVNTLNFTVEKVEWMSNIRNTLGGASYKPENGRFLVVYYRFRGRADNEQAGYDTAAIKVMDRAGQYYDDLNGQDALMDLSRQKSLEMLGFAFVNDPEEKSFIDVYDVPADAQKLVWLRTVSVSPLKLEVLAELDITEARDATESIQTGSARNWFDAAMAEAQDWQADARLFELHAENAATGLRQITDEDELAKAMQELPMDGTAETWEYYFISENSDVSYEVVITQGEIIQSKEASLFMTREYEDLISPEKWQFDSDKALELARKQVKLDLGSGALVSFDLYNGGHRISVNGQYQTVPMLCWEIKFRTANGEREEVEIDATSGDILK